MANPFRGVRTKIRTHFAPVQRLTPLAPDASTRAFFRLERKARKTFVVMADPQGGLAAVDRMVAAHDLLHQIGVRVPALFMRADDIPALLMEDFGDTLLADALAKETPSQREIFYTEAGRMAGRIAAQGTRLVVPGSILGTPRLGAYRLRTELALFTVYDVGGRRNIRDAVLLKDVAALSERIVFELTAQPPQLAHRDFHSRNLMVLSNTTLGVVDYQDTLMAPPLYDLASLLRDPYAAPNERLCRMASTAYTAEIGIGGDMRHDPRFSWVALQRDLKAIGTYAFQARRFNRVRFLDYIPAAEALALQSAQELPVGIREAAVDLLRRLGFRKG